MRTYQILDRILGVYWLLFCSFYGAFMVWEICHVFAISQSPQEDSVWIRVMSVSILICLVYFVGVVASVFLLRGASWARKSVGFVAITVVLFAIANWSLDVWTVVRGAFALASACCLLIPRGAAAAYEDS